MKYLNLVNIVVQCNSITVLQSNCTINFRHDSHGLPEQNEKLKCSDVKDRTFIKGGGESWCK